MSDLDRRNIRRRWRKIIHQCAGQKLTIFVVCKLLVEGGTNPLRHTTLNLPVYDHGINHRAAVFNYYVAQNLDLAGFDVDLDRHDVCGVRMSHGWGLVVGCCLQSSLFAFRKVARRDKNAASDLPDGNERRAVRLSSHNAIGKLEVSFRNLSKVRSHSDDFFPHLARRYGHRSAAGHRAAASPGAPTIRYDRCVALDNLYVA